MKKDKKVTEVWVILDPKDGPHAFLTKELAAKTWRAWKQIAKQDDDDSFWDMTNPEKYIKEVK